MEIHHYHVSIAHHLAMIGNRLLLCFSFIEINLAPFIGWLAGWPDGHERTNDVRPKWLKARTNRENLICTCRTISRLSEFNLMNFSCLFNEVNQHRLLWNCVCDTKSFAAKYQDSFTMATKRDKINRKESCNSITVIQIGTSTSFAAEKFSTREWISISIHHGKLRADLSITTNKYVPTNGIGIKRSSAANGFTFKTENRTKDIYTQHKYDKRSSFHSFGFVH